MNTNKIRLLIVDDSIILRKMLERIVEADADIEVIGTATNGKDALAKAHQLKPDVITMDVLMPVMDGIEATRRIMTECPTRILMLSGLTQVGAVETLAALEAGAVDFQPKPDRANALRMSQLAETVLGKIHLVATAQLQPRMQARQALLQPTTVIKPHHQLVVIGTSTGGPKALVRIISQLPEDLPVGGLIVQHMPPAYTSQLATRLNQLGGPAVKEAEEGDFIQPGLVLLAPGHSHLILRNRNQVGLSLEPANAPHRPSVDVMVTSAALQYGHETLGVIMTGMGEDGKKGLALLKAKGGTVIAQDEATCSVYGMPRAVIEAGLADEVLPLDQIPAAILRRLH